MLGPTRLRPWEFTVYEDAGCVVPVEELRISAAARSFTGPAELTTRLGWLIEPLDPRRSWLHGLVLVNRRRRTATGWAVRPDLSTDGRTVLTPGLVTLGVYPQLRGWRVVIEAAADDEPDPTEPDFTEADLLL